MSEASVTTAVADAGATSFYIRPVFRQAFRVLAKRGALFFAIAAAPFFFVRLLVLLWTPLRHMDFILSPCLDAFAAAIVVCGSMQTLSGTSFAFRDTSAIFNSHLLKIGIVAIGILAIDKIFALPMLFVVNRMKTQMLLHSTSNYVFLALAWEFISILVQRIVYSFTIPIIILGGRNIRRDLARVYARSRGHRAKIVACVLIAFALTRPLMAMKTAANHFLISSLAYVIDVSINYTSFVFKMIVATSIYRNLMGDADGTDISRFTSIF